MGHQLNQTLASRSAGSLTIQDTAEAVLFEATLPLPALQTTWQRDFVLSHEQQLIRGISPGFTVPPLGTVPNAERLIPEAGNPGVNIRSIRQAVLFEMSAVTRPAYGETVLESREESHRAPLLATGPGDAAMAVTVAQIANAAGIVPLGETVPAPLEARLSLAQGASEAFIDLLAPNAPEGVRDFGVIKMAVYLDEAPLAGRRDAYAYAFQNSGASSLLLPWTPLLTADGTGLTASVPGMGGGGPGEDAIARASAAAAQATADAVRTDLTTHEGMPHGGGVDQTARDAAAAAQSEIDGHEGSTHNTDIVARSTARNARQTGEQAQTELETHRNSTHNTDATARSAAATVGRDLATHETTPHGGTGGVDQTARDSAAAAQSEIDTHEAAPITPMLRRVQQRQPSKRN